MDGTDKHPQRIESFRLSYRLLEETLSALTAEGRYKVESMVFWAGEVCGSTAAITRILVPKGRGVFRRPFQLRIDASVAAALCDYLDPPNIVLLGQVHTHLEGAFHSWADDSFTFETPGYLSLVVPRFGREGIRGWRKWGFFECVGTRVFREIVPGELRRRFLLSRSRKAKVETYEVRA